MQTSGSMYSCSAVSKSNAPGFGWMQSTGQTSMQESSLMQLPAITYAIGTGYIPGKPGCNSCDSRRPPAPGPAASSPPAAGTALRSAPPRLVAASDPDPALEEIEHGVSLGA